MMHYYQFNIGDYIKHTARLSLMEDLAYRRMLDLYYLNDGAITSDVNRLARQIGMPENKVEIEFILSEFFILRDDSYHNSRADREISDYAAKADRARVNGKSGGRPRKEKEPTNNPVGFESVPKVNPEESESKANHKPLTINQEPIINTHVISQRESDEEVAEKENIKRQKKCKPYKYEDVANAYNEITSGIFPSISKMTEKRKRAVDKLMAELKEPSIDCMTAYLNAFTSSAGGFYRGDGPRGWKADFDYIVRVETMIKVKEGSL